MTVALQDVLGRLEGVVKCGEGYSARCPVPAHDDRRQSLSLAHGEKGIVLHCHAGCPTERVCGAIGLSLADLFETNGNGHREVVATYPYTDENGELLFEVVRFGPDKDFRQRRPDGTWGIKGIRRVPYRLPQVLEAVKSGRPVYVVEGEKDVEAIEGVGGVATCNPGGVGMGWRDEYSEHFRGADVTIVADDDEPGRKHAAAVHAALLPVAASVRVVLPAQGNDTSDHLRAGKRLQDFRPIEVEETRPRVYSGLDLAAMKVDTPRPVCDGLLYEGCSTLLIGQPKLAGKTTLSLDIARCIIAGEPWCGRQTMRSPVLYLSEQSPHSFNPQVERAGLHAADFHVMYYADFIGTDWPEIAAFATEAANERGCRVVFIDNYALWVGFTGEQENQSGPAMEAMRPVEQMKAAGITVAILTHSRKEGGSIAELARGSGATIGLYDVLASLKGDSVPRRRVLDVTGRPFAETPEPFYVTFTDEHRYTALGDHAEVSANDLRDLICLSFWTEDGPMTDEQIITFCKGAGFGHNKVSEALRRMSEEGVIARQRGVIPGRRGFGYCRKGRSNATAC